MAKYDQGGGTPKPRWQVGQRFELSVSVSRVPNLYNSYYSVAVQLATSPHPYAIELSEADLALHRALEMPIAVGDRVRRSCSPDTGTYTVIAVVDKEAWCKTPGSFQEFAHRVFALTELVRAE